MATKYTCLELRGWARASLVIALALPGACAEDAQGDTVSAVVTDGAVLGLDAGGSLMGGGPAGGGTAGAWTGGTTGGGADAGEPWAGAGGAGATGGGAGFPRRGEAVQVAAAGPYAVGEYDGPLEPLIDSSRIYYPTNAAAPFAFIALSPGFTNVKEDFLWWGPTLASHGFVIALLSPTSSLDFPDERADDLEAGIALLKAENARSDSPLFGKLDVNRAGILGHSMGGGATLLVMARSGSTYQAAVAWEPWETSLQTDRTVAPTMILAGEFDLVADANGMAWPFYQGIPNTTTKAYAEFAGLGHNTVNALGAQSDRELHAKWTIAWMKLHLEGDARYDVFVKNGPELARFARAPAAQ